MWDHQCKRQLRYGQSGEVKKKKRKKKKPVSFKKPGKNPWEALKWPRDTRRELLVKRLKGGTGVKGNGIRLNERMIFPCGGVKI